MKRIFSDKVLKYSSGATFGILGFMLLVMYWTLRRGEYVIIEPNISILVFEIIMIIWLMLTQLDIMLGFNTKVDKK